MTLGDLGAVAKQLRKLHERATGASYQEYWDDFRYFANAHGGQVAAAMLAALPVVEAAVYAEDILGFHEGSEQVLRDGTQPVVCINAQGDDGDFQVTLGKLRSALAAFAEAIAEMKP